MVVAFGSRYTEVKDCGSGPGAALRERIASPRRVLIMLAACHAWSHPMRMCVGSKDAAGMVA